MPNSTPAASRATAMRAIVTDMEGADRRECLVLDATPSGCRLSGNVDGLPDVICIQVSGVAQPMKGRVTSRGAGSLAVTFAWSETAEPEADPEAEEPVETMLALDKVVESSQPPILEPGQSSAELSDEEVMEIYFRLEKSLRARLGSQGH